MTSLQTNKPSESFFKYFAQKTHFNGFTELMEAKSYISRLTWAIIILMALTIATYQIFKSIMHDQTAQTHAVVEFLGDRQVIYPPITLCFYTWIDWVNWTKISEFNLTKNELIYAMSFVSVSFSNNYWDVNETAESFDQKMKQFNFTSIEQFYFSLAKRFELDNQSVESCNGVKF